MATHWATLRVASKVPSSRFSRQNWCLALLHRQIPPILPLFLCNYATTAYETLTRCVCLHHIVYPTEISQHSTMFIIRGQIKIVNFMSGPLLHRSNWLGDISRPKFCFVPLDHTAWTISILSVHILGPFGLRPRCSSATHFDLDLT